MKNNWISLLALLVSVIALIITFLRIDVTISNDAFIGIVASFVGAAATIIVGAQLYNSIEMSRKIEKINSMQNTLRNELEKAKKERKDNSLKMEVNIRRVHAISLIKFQPISSFVAFSEALKFALGSEDIVLVTRVLDDLGGACSIIKREKGEFNFAHINEFECDCSSADLEKYSLYKLFVKERYEGYYAEFLQIITDRKEKKK